MNDKLIKVNLSKIDNFKEHPFLVNNDSSLMELVKRIDTVSGFIKFTDNDIIYMTDVISFTSELFNSLID